jgi:hypothetical protein
MFGDDVNAQAGTGRTNPSATNTPPILTSAFHQSWLNVSGVTMDRVQTQTWTTPPEHAGGLWHLDSSGAADPNSQYTAAATWTGAPNYAAGRFGQAVTTSPGNYLRIPNDSAISRSNDFTVDAWFRTTDLSQSPYAKLVIKSTNTGCGAGTDCNFGIYLGRDTGNICGASISTSGTKYSVCRSHSGLIDGSWHHAAITVSSTNVLQLYLDGLPAGAAQAMNNQARTTTNDMTVGNTLDNGNPFVGDIDEVRFSPVAYDAAAIAGYFRTSRPHAQQLWTLASTALGANCTTATRCEDQAYAGVAEILRPGARYWQRTRLNTLNNDYWTDYGIDWLETESTSTITITAGATVAFGSQLPGIDAFGTTDIDVTSNSPAGYQLLARDEDDAWALQRTPATDSIADLQNGADPPAAWVSGAAGYFGVGVLDATGNRLPKWGSLGGPWPTTDTTNNLYTGLENSTDVLLHERTSYSLATDTITMISRVNAGPTDLAGDYDGLITLTAVANP